MKSRIRVELPPVGDAWQEVAHNWFGVRATWPARRAREEGARRALLSVRALVSFEEVYGRGLLERFNSVPEGAEMKKQLGVVSIAYVLAVAIFTAAGVAATAPEQHGPAKTAEAKQ